VSLTATLTNTDTGEKSSKVFVVTILQSLTDADAVALCKANLDASGFVFAAGDSTSHVSQNFSLPLTQNDCAVSWSAGGSSWISSISNVTGLVTLSRQVASSDETVALTATLSRNRDSGATDTKALSVTILRYLTNAEVDACAAAVGIGSLSFTAPDTSAGVTQDFSLPSTITANGALCTLTWTESPDTNVVAISGTTLSTTRPSYTAGNAAVVLKATASGGSPYTKQSSDVGFTVSKLPATDLERANECRSGFSASNITYSSPDNSAAVTKNFTLPDSLVISGNSCNFTAWQSNSAAIVLSGTEQRSASVTRPADDQSNATVVLSGTVSYNGTPASSLASATVAVQKYSEAESVAACKAALTTSDFTGITVTTATAGTVAVASTSMTFPVTKTGVGGKSCTVSWSSNNISYISVSAGNGSVTHGYDAADTYVTLTPTISRGSASDSAKTFSMRVKSLFTAPTLRSTVAQENKTTAGALSINYVASNVTDSSQIVYKICVSQDSTEVDSISAMDSAGASCQTSTTAYANLNSPLVIQVNGQSGDVWYANVYSMVQGQPDSSSKKILYDVGSATFE
jgi:hypothetical protein